jgi:hypothetical protein
MPKRWCSMWTRWLNTPIFKPSLFNNDNLRYSSQNLKALAQFGSLEYRGMRGVHDPALLHAWASGLQGMSELTKSFKSPIEVLDYFDTRGSDEFIRRVLPPTLQSMVLKQNDYAKGMSESFDIIFDTVYNTDWDDVDKAVEKYTGRMDKPLEPIFNEDDFSGELEVAQAAPQPVSVPPPNGGWTQAGVVNWGTVTTNTVGTRPSQMSATEFVQRFVDPLGTPVARTR